MSEDQKAQLVQAAENGDLAAISRSHEETPLDSSIMQEIACAAAKSAKTDVLAFALSNGVPLKENRDLLIAVFDSVDTKACFDMLLSPPYNLDPDVNVGYVGTPLINGIKSKNIPFLKMLLERGANPDSGGLGPSSLSPLEVAACFGTKEILTLLLDAGAHTQDSGALQAAAKRGREDSVRELLARGADPDELVSKVRRKQRLPRTALAEAVVNGNAEISKVLIDAGASVNAQDAQGSTVLDLVRTEGSQEVKDIFQSRNLLD